MCDINSKTPMEKLTIGGNIYKAGNARKFKTGDSIYERKSKDKKRDVRSFKGTR